jgi:hypothetical protein
MVRKASKKLISENANLIVFFYVNLFRPNHDNTSYTQISLTDESTPFSMIPSHFPQQEENLLSEWPAELSMKKSYRPRPIDQVHLHKTFK